MSTVTCGSFTYWTPSLRLQRALEIEGGDAARLDAADQRHGDPAAVIDRVDARQVRLPVDEDAQLVAGIEQIGAVGIGDGLRTLQRDGHHRRRAPGVQCRISWAATGTGASTATCTVVASDQWSS